jgi:hypothetical protein
MKIEIEFENSYEAVLRIDGHEMRVISKPGQSKLEGIKGDDLELTLGGIVAGRLWTKIPDIQQAWCEVSEFDPEAETWTVLSEEAAEAAENRIF